MKIIYAARSGYKAVLYGCMTTASSWSDCPTAPPTQNKGRCFLTLKKKAHIILKGTVVAAKDRYTFVSYGFVHLYTSHPTHIPQIPTAIR